MPVPAREHRRGTVYAPFPSNGPEILHQPDIQSRPRCPSSGTVHMTLAVSRFPIPHTCLSQIPNLHGFQGLLHSVHLKASQPLHQGPPSQSSSLRMIGLYQLPGTKEHLVKELFKITLLLCSSSYKYPSCQNPQQAFSCAQTPVGVYTVFSFSSKLLWSLPQYVLKFFSVTS
jgi:hypothetical protein